VTSVARTQLDVAGMLAAGPLERAVERALSLRLFDLSATRAVLEANPRRPGAATLANIVATIYDEPHITRSELEALMRDLCAAHGIAPPAVNTIVEGVEVDFFWRAERLIVETDGVESHGTRAGLRARPREGRAPDGARVPRRALTYRQLVYERSLVAATLLALLAPSAA